ncbi:CRISP/Allergen/PR-1-like [Pollicipes pollicipes]|uniref:CRISP/Allergen/PR-1-like n=1 Tax=Pollicipes pollicipes TaxID=41117 RepID=UPI0018859571|nr:CRISP/Allergen/PR-1-like [Pollicipes pollicipes]
MRCGWSVVFCAAAVVVARAQNQYCRFTPKHTLCQFQGPGPACDQLQARQVSAQEAKYIVAEHNRLRSKVANGRETRGKSFAQPSASNMRQLEWDEELARGAQRHAEQCVFQHDCRDCKRVARFKVGQNLYSSSSTRLENAPEWKRAVYAWYDEVAMFDPQRIEPFVFETSIGHYTQMVWAETTRIGCGYTLYKEGPWWTKLYVCNYGAAGNFQRGQMYERGAACSNCPSGTTCSREFPGICTEDATLPATTPAAMVRPTARPPTRRPPTAQRPRPTATAPPRRPAPATTLLSCDLDRDGCSVKYAGSTWKIIRTSSAQRRILGTAVTFGRSSQLTFQSRVQPPRSGTVCVTFAYMKYELRGSSPVDLLVSLEPLTGGRAARRVVRPNARGQMRRGRVQLEEVSQPGRLRFSAAVPSFAFGQATVLALDDVKVTSGPCARSP